MTAIAGYEILRELGRGGGGRVYLARDAALGRNVAIKVLAPELTLAPDAELRFRREATALAELDHPNVVPIYRFDRDPEGRVFLVMRAIEGESLRQLIAHAPLSITRVTEIAVGVARGLAAAHSRGILHRDVKPENVIVSETGEPVLIDFGLARGAADERITVASEFLGTRAYAAPEVLQGKAAAATAMADVYSLGALIFEALTLLPASGRSPPLSPRAERAEVPAPLDAIVAKATAQRPHERYADAGALAQDLESFLAGKPVCARPPSRVLRALGRLRVPLALLGVLAAFVGTGLLSARGSANRERRNMLVREVDEAEHRGRFKDALAACDAALKLEPGDPSLLRRRATIAADARRAFDTAFERARAALDTGDAASALDFLAGALVASPEDERALALRARAIESSRGTRVSFTGAGGGRVSLRTETGWDDLGAVPTVPRSLRSGVVVVSVVASFAHTMELPVLVPERSGSDPIRLELPAPPRLRADRASMVFVPETEAVIGGAALNAISIAPVRTRVAAFWIDRREVLASELEAFRRSSDRARRDVWSEAGWAFRERAARDRYGSRPLAKGDAAAAYVSRFEAEAYARWKGLRLPSQVEWEVAARGPYGQTYPWGERPRDDLLAPPREPLAPGSRPDDESPYGCLDLGGNVAEWTSSNFVELGHVDPNRAIVKGGGVGFPAELGLARAAARATLDPGDEERAVGFRCAADGD